MKFYWVVVDSIPHNSTEAIVKATLEEAGMGEDESTVQKTLHGRARVMLTLSPRAPWTNFSMISVEIKVVVDEDTRPILMI